MSAFVVVALSIEGKVIDPLANKIFTIISTQIAISDLLKELLNSSSDNSCEPHEKPQSSDGSSTTSSEDSQQYKNLNPAQTKAMKSMCQQLKDNETASKAIASSDLKPMSNFKLFCMVYATHHYVLAIFTSCSCNYSRKSMIVMVYTRIVYGLALTMFFAMGMNKDGFSSYQSFVSKCIISPIFISGAFIIIKRLLKNEKNYGLSMLKWCPKKDALPNSSSISNKVSAVNPKNQLTRVPSKTLSDRSLGDLNDNPTATKHPQSGSDTPLTNSGSPGSPLFSKSLTKPASSSLVAAGTNKIGGLVMVLVGYVISTALVPLCGMIIYSVTLATNSNQTWPFGYWFVLQLTYDMTLGQALPAALQLGMLKIYLAGKAGKGGFVGFLGKYNPFLNTDVAELTKMSQSMKSSRGA